jgi:hypothetical protein
MFHTLDMSHNYLKGMHIPFDLRGISFCTQNYVRESQRAKVLPRCAIARPNHVAARCALILPMLPCSLAAAAEHALKPRNLTIPSPQVIAATASSERHVAAGEVARVESDVSNSPCPRSREGQEGGGSRVGRGIDRGDSAGRLF